MLTENDNDGISSDIAIVKRIQEGDKQAYNILVIKYQHKVLQIAQKFVNNQNDANDVAQDAFIKAYRAIGSFRGDSNFYTWLYRIVVNSAKTYLEQNAKHAKHLDVDLPLFEEHGDNGFMTSNESPDKVMESEELKKVIFTAIAALPEELQTALKMREIEGMSYDEIALAMDAPVGTVKSRIFRARQYIEEQMALFGVN